MSNSNPNNEQTPQGNTPAFTPGANQNTLPNKTFLPKNDQNTTDNNQGDKNKKNPFKVTKDLSPENGNGNQRNLGGMGNADVASQQQSSKLPPHNPNQDTQIKQDTKVTNPFLNKNNPPNNQNQPNNATQTQNRNKPSPNIFGQSDQIKIAPFSTKPQPNDLSNLFKNNLPMQSPNSPSQTPGAQLPVPMFPHKSGDKNNSNTSQTPSKTIVPIVIKAVNPPPVSGANSIFSSNNTQSQSIFNNNNTQSQPNNPFVNNNTQTKGANVFMNNNTTSVFNNNTFAKPSDISTNAPTSILKNNVKIEDTTKIETETKVQNQAKVQNAPVNIFSNPTGTVKTEATTKQQNIFNPIPKPITTIPPKPAVGSEIPPNTPSTTNTVLPSASVSLSSTPSSPNSPNYSNLYQEASKSSSNIKQPPTPPMAESCDYFQPMSPDVFKLYLDSESMKLLAFNDPESMKKHIETNQPILMKLFMNLQHYYQSPKRTQFYNQKYKITQNLGFPKKVYLNLFVGKTEEASWFYDFLKILISDIAIKLDTDELIAHYFIGKALQKTKFYEKFIRTTQAGTHNISYDALKTLLNQDDTQINYKNKYLKELIEEVNLAYIRDRVDLLETVIHILNDKNKEYRGMRNTAISLNIEQFLWNTYKSLANKQLVSDFPFNDSAYWKNEFQSQIIQEEYKILRLIVSLTNRYLESARYPRMMDFKDVLRVFDEQKFVGSTNKYGKYALALKIQENQINILLNLLPLFEMVNSQKGTYEILKNKHFNKEMYEAILKSKSEQAYVFKNLLPSIKQIYQLKDVADYNQKSLGLVEKYVQNSFRWMIWLQVYLQNPVIEIGYRNKFRIYCIILNQSCTELWDYGTYPNIKKQIIALMKSQKTSRIDKSSTSSSHSQQYQQSTTMDDVFQLMTKLLGVRGSDSVEPVITFMSRHLGKDFLYQNICKPLIGCIQDRRKLYTVQSPNSQYYFDMNSKSFTIMVQFLTKCIIIHSKELKWIQDWLFLTPMIDQSQYQSKHKTLGGIKLVVFLFDCIIFFKNKKACKILKFLFDALTQIILNKTDIKLISVAASICYYQYRADGGLYNMIQKLCNPQNAVEVELRASILLHLKAILKIPFVENYFVFPNKRTTDISKIYQEFVVRREIVHRYEKIGERPQILNDLCDMESAQSLWLPDILNILKASNDSLSLEIFALMLEKMCIPSQDYSPNQYNLFSQFIQVLNESNLESTVLQALDITDLNNALQSSNIKNNIESFHNKALYQYKKNTNVQKDQEFQQINTRIYFSLKVIQHSLELLQMLIVKDPKQALTNGMIQKVKIVQYVNEWLGKKMSIYHYEKSYSYNLRERSERYNLVMVIAAHFKIDYNLHIAQELPFYVLNLEKKQDVPMAFKYWKECNIQLFSNVQKRPDRFSNTKLQTTSIRVLRVLTKCLLFWGKVDLGSKPSLYSLLAQPNTEVARALNYREEIHYLFKLMINKIIEFSPKKDSSEICEIFNFFICLLNIQPPMIGCLFQELHGFSSLNKLLQKGINTIFFWSRYQKQQVYAVHKILIFLKDLIKNTSYRTEGLRMINGQIYIPAQAIKNLPKNTLQNQISNLCSPQVQQNEIYNVINQQQIYFHLVRYSIIQSIIEITLQNILNNCSIFQGNYDIIFEHLYLGGLSKQILSCKETSELILSLISNYFVKLQLPYQSYEWGSIKYVDVNSYGYGRNYQIIPMKKELLNLSIKQSEDIYAKFHKYNIVKSLETVKKIALNRWSQLFIVLGSTGKHGYSISHSNKSLNLSKMKDDFGNAFSLLNTKMFKIQKGFEDIISSRIDLLANMVSSIIDKTITTEIIDYQSITQNKLSMLQMIFKWIYRLNPRAGYVSKLAQQSFEYLTKIFDNSQSYKKSLFASSLLNTLGLVYRTNKMNTQQITKTAILLYLDPDCLARNVMISSFVPQLSKHAGTKYFKELCGKMIALQLIQNPDPIDYLIITKALFQFQKVDEDILLNFRYFSQLPSSINLNINSDMNIQLWRFQIVAHFLVKQHNLFQLKEILCYLQNIKLTFRSILANSTDINFIYLPKHLEEKNSHKTIHIEYLLLYLSQLKILKLLIQNRTVLQHQSANIGQFVSDFFQNKLIPQIHQYQHIEGEPLLKEVPKSKQNLKQYSSQYKKNILQFMFQVVSLDTILLYVQILKTAVSLGLWKAQHQIQSILKSLQNQLFNRLDTNLRYKECVKESFVYYHAYLNSVQTSIKMFYTNTLLSKYTYDQYIDQHKQVLQCIYDTGFILIQKKQSCYEIYKPDFQKQLENFRNWTIKGAKRMKQFFKKDGEKY